MEKQTTDLNGRRLIATGPYLPLAPVFVFDQAGKQIGRFKSPRKLRKAIASGAVVLLADDTNPCWPDPGVVS